MESGLCSLRPLLLEIHIDSKVLTSCTFTTIWSQWNVAAATKTFTCGKRIVLLSQGSARKVTWKCGVGVRRCACTKLLPCVTPSVLNRYFSHTYTYTYKHIMLGKTQTDSAVCAQRKYCAAAETADCSTITIWARTLLNNRPVIQQHNYYIGLVNRMILYRGKSC